MSDEARQNLERLLPGDIRLGSKTGDFYAGTADVIGGRFWISEDTSAFWQAKFDANVERDARSVRDLRRAGWDVEVVWECETKDVNALEAKLRRFLG